MNHDKDTHELREIELLDEDLTPIAGGAGGLVTNPGSTEFTPVFDPNRGANTIGTFKDPIIRAPLERVGGGVNRGFPGIHPEVEDVTVKGEVTWSNSKP